jgi:hypothetical protein
VTCCYNRAVVSSVVKLPYIRKNRSMWTDPDVTGVEETARSGVVHKSKALPIPPVVTLGRYPNCQEHDLMAAFEKFKSKINIMEKRTAQVRHFPTKEEHFHYVY